MKISELPGQTVWVEAGTPVLLDSETDAPGVVAHFVYVKVDRVTEPTRELPALAVWRDGDHERGVDAASVLRHVMSLPPAGDAWIVRAGSAIGEKIGVTRKTR